MYINCKSKIYFSKKLNELNCTPKCYEKLHGGPVVVSLSATYLEYLHRYFACAAQTSVRPNIDLADSKKNPWPIDWLFLAMLVKTDPLSYLNVDKGS